MSLVETKDRRRWILKLTLASALVLLAGCGDQTSTLPSFEMVSAVIDGSQKGKASARVPFRNKDLDTLWWSFEDQPLIADANSTHSNDLSAGVESSGVSFRTRYTWLPEQPNLFYEISALDSRMPDVISHSWLSEHSWVLYLRRDQVKYLAAASTASDTSTGFKLQAQPAPHPRRSRHDVSHANSRLTRRQHRVKPTTASCQTSRQSV